MESHAAPFRHVEAASAGHRDAPIMGAGLKALWVARILVACRVSILSVVAGVLLFLLALPARDLFADITFGALQASVRARVFWSAFFTYLVFVWAFPVHYAARRMLYSDAWMFSCRVRADIAPHKFAEIRKDLGWWIDWIPRWLAAVPFLAVLIGLWKAHSVVARTPALPPAAEAARQIHILVGLDVAIGLVFLVFLWRRRILAKRLSSRVAFALAWSYMAIVSLLFIASLTRPFLPADLAQRAAIVPLLLGCFVFFGTFLAWASHKICVPVLALSIVAALCVTALNPHFNDVRTLDRTSEDYSTRQIDIEDAVSKWKAANCDQQKISVRQRSSSPWKAGQAGLHSPPQPPLANCWTSRPIRWTPKTGPPRRRAASSRFPASPAVHSGRRRSAPRCRILSRTANRRARIRPPIGSALRRAM
jgi:hypothetical protein